MEATETFENLLLQLKQSQLNFKLELSPFSAHISVKKSFIKDKTGKPLPPPTLKTVELQQNYNLQQEIRMLQQKLYSLEKATEVVKLERANAVDDADECHRVNLNLLSEIMHLKSQLVCVKTEELEVSVVTGKAQPIEDIRNELFEKSKKLEDIIDQNKNYKTEVKHLNGKHGK